MISEYHATKKRYLAKFRDAECYEHTSPMRFCTPGATQGTYILNVTYCSSAGKKVQGPLLMGSQ